MISLCEIMKNILTVNDFEDKCKELDSLIKVHSIDIEKTLDEIKCNTTKIEYGKGGTLMHRGYYCPSLIEEFVIGNARRGRLLKKDFNDADHIYYFNNDGKLFAIDQTECYLDICVKCIELIEYKSNETLGANYSGLGNLINITRCIYDNNKLISHEQGSLSTLRVNHLDSEYYFYDLNGYLDYVDEYSFLLNFSILGFNRYKFLRNKNNKIIGFNRKEIYENKVKSDVNIYKKFNKNF